MKLAAALWTLLACIFFPEAILWMIGALVAGIGVAMLLGVKLFKR